MRKQGSCIAILFLSSLLSLLFSVSAHADHDPKIHQAITENIKSLFPNAHVGLVIQDLKTNELVYAQQADKYFTPASTMKLFTSYAALSYLAPDFNFKTELKFDPTKINPQGVLQGDVILSFSGDPTFTDAKLSQLLAPLKNKGIKKITGKILIENHGFTMPHASPGATWDTWSYYPPVSSIILNENVVLVKIQPSTKLDQPCLANLEKNPGSMDLPPVSLSHKITTVSAEQAEQSCSLDVVVNPNNDIHLSGCWPINEPNTILWVSLASPEKALEKKIMAFLKKSSIQFNPKTIHFSASDSKPHKSDLATVAHISSAPLSDLIKPILQDSNNLYADSLHKKLGEKYYGIGSYAYGVKAQQEILGKLGISVKLNQQFDGSGASRYNLLSPNQLVALLTHIHNDKKSYQYIKKALPISGNMGSLKNRFQTEKTLISKDKIHAKTGSLKNISALAGYLTPSATQHYAFALMIQGEPGKMKLIKAKEDILLSEISQLLVAKPQA